MLLDGEDNPLTAPAPLNPIVTRMAILLGSEAGRLVADPFCGFGETLIAASEYGRPSFGIELSPVFAEAAKKRYEETLPTGVCDVYGGE